jgi:hypothetical protein
MLKINYLMLLSTILLSISHPKHETELTYENLSELSMQQNKFDQIICLVRSLKQNVIFIISKISSKNSKRYSYKRV